MATPTPATRTQSTPPVPAKSPRYAQRALIQALDALITDTRVCFTEGGTEYFAGPMDKPVEATLDIRRPRFFDRVLAYGNLGLGEAFMDHDFDIVQGTLTGFLHLLLRNRVDQKFRKTPQLIARALATRVQDIVRGNNRNVQAHYDLPLDVFEATLDTSLTYTCGYVRSTDESIEELERNKLDRICRKLRLRRGETLGDIGFGFGSLLIFAAENYGVKGRGINISKVQFEYATQEIRRRGLADRIQLVFGDYKNFDGQYDKVACAGLLEHLPHSDYPKLFRVIGRVLKPGGFAVLQSVGCTAAKNEHDPFTQKYVFPGSTQSRLSEIARGFERNGLITVDVENLARHYHYTTAGWLKKFLSNRAILAKKHDERFLRMFEYYLAGGAAMALGSDSALWQILATNDRAADLALARV